MNRKKIHTLLDDAIDAVNGVTEEINNTVAGAVDAVKVKAAPNKFQLGQVITSNNSSWTVTSMRLTRSNKVLYTLTDEDDEVVKDIAEKAIIA